MEVWYANPRWYCVLLEVGILAAGDRRHRQIDAVFSSSGIRMHRSQNRILMYVKKDTGPNWVTIKTQQLRSVVGRFVLECNRVKTLTAQVENDPV